MMRFLLAAVLALQCLVVQAAGFDHSIWDGLLKKHLLTLRGGQTSQLDYVGMTIAASTLIARFSLPKVGIPTDSPRNPCRPALSATPA